MKRRLVTLSIASALVAACGSNNNSTSPSGNTPVMSFFVTSQKSTTGNLGGLRGADATCQTLAAAVGAGSRTWKAYLSAERDIDNGTRPANARDRIGSGPWSNVHGVLVASHLTELHARKGDAAVFIDERGQRINGQW